MAQTKPFPWPRKYPHGEGTARHRRLRFRSPQVSQLANELSWRWDAGQLLFCNCTPSVHPRGTILPTRSFMVALSAVPLACHVPSEYLSCFSMVQLVCVVPLRLNKWPRCCPCLQKKDAAVAPVPVKPAPEKEKKRKTYELPGQIHDPPEEVRIASRMETAVHVSCLYILCTPYRVCTTHVPLMCCLYTICGSPVNACLLHVYCACTACVPCA